MNLGIFMFRLALAVPLLNSAVGSASGNPGGAAAEPSAETAAAWWPPQFNVWTPVGWKDHLFRFNVVYNGTVISDPCAWCMPHRQPWAGQGVQLDFVPSAAGELPTLPDRVSLLKHLDGGYGNQGWRMDHPSPLLWTEWRLQEGAVLRKEIFAHLRGSREIETGVEPLYAWIRLSVSHVDELRALERFHFMVRLAGIYYRRRGVYRFEDGVVLEADPGASAYPRQLSARSFEKGPGVGCQVLEPDGRIRLVVLPAAPGSTTFLEQAPGGKVYYLKVELPARAGARVDLLLPAIPGDPQEIEEETALGFDEALRRSDEYWSYVPATAARIRTPEAWFNHALAYALKFAEIIAERNPETGEYSFLSGSWGYDALWSTPTSMVSHMFLDLIGYHEVVEKHIEIHRGNQGTVKPPGAAYQMHPGYFSTPKTLTSIDWLSDHGAVLHLAAYHGLVTGDESFIASWTDAIVKGCEFVKDSCAIKGHEGIAGLLPPAVATDDGIPCQAVWNLGWNYKGLVTAVRLLRTIGHPRAEEFDAFAREYQATFVRAFRKAAEETPEWTDRNGNRHRLVPTSLSSGPDFTHPFFLDTGPMFLVWSGLMDAEDQLMKLSVRFFREGPNQRLFGVRSNPLCRPVLIHEIASCEPCYSWNIVHSWQLGDRYRYLEGMYSLLTGALSPQTYISSEHRHGMYGNIFAVPLLVWAARQSVIDDAISPGDLHLLRLCPLAWIRSDMATVFEGMPTEFGPVGLEFRLSEDEKGLLVSYRPRFRMSPRRVIFHLPPVEGLTWVRINGKKHAVGKQAMIRLD